MELSVRNEVVGGHPVVVVDGSIDLASVPVLQDHLVRTIIEHGGATVAVDLDAARAIDDVGVGVLLGAAARARSNGGDIVLVTSSDRLRDRFAELGVDRSVTVVAATTDVPQREERAARYVAVIFTAQRTDDDEAGYADMAALMEELAAAQPGYLGIDSVRDDRGLGITVSYWATPADAQGWKRHADHLVAQRNGRGRWYSHYTVRVATVDREYGFTKQADVASGQT